MAKSIEKRAEEMAGRILAHGTAKEKRLEQKLQDITEKSKQREHELLLRLDAMRRNKNAKRTEDLLGSMEYLVGRMYELVKMYKGVS